MNGQSKLIKPGEQLQIPTNNIDTKLLNSPPPSPATNKQMDLINPSPENNLTKTEQKNSRPGSQINNEKHVDDEIIPTKSRPISNSSQQHPTITAQKPNSTASSRKGSTASESDQKNKIDSRRSSTDADLVKQERILSNDQRKSPLEKRSAQQSRKNSSKTIDQTVVTPMKINSSKSRQDEKVNYSN
jgi:ATP-dependent exoDNAse (exonuclease V) alpha subunit